MRCACITFKCVSPSLFLFMFYVFFILFTLSSSHSGPGAGRCVTCGHYRLPSMQLCLSLTAAAWCSSVAKPALTLPARGKRQLCMRSAIGTAWLWSALCSIPRIRTERRNAEGRAVLMPSCHPVNWDMKWVLFFLFFLKLLVYLFTSSIFSSAVFVL